MMTENKASANRPVPFEELIKENEKLTKMLKAVETAKKEWERSLDCIEDVIIITDLKDNILRCNRAFSSLTGKTYQELLGRKWQEVLEEKGITHRITNAGEIEMLYPGAQGARWFNYNLNAIRDAGSNKTQSAVITLTDITALKNMTEKLKEEQEALANTNLELDTAYKKLKTTQIQLLQQEKMASIGQIAAGVAHEINNPVGFVMSNLGSLKKYMDRLFEFIKVQSAALEEMAKQGQGTDSRGPDNIKSILNKINEAKHSTKLDFILEDVVNLVRESIDGTERIRQIVQELKSFSRVDEASERMSDINAGIESTINIVWNELKYKATLKKELGSLPMTKCNPGQMNQVFMNLLINAAHAIEKQGEIAIKTWYEDNNIYVAVSDTGCGIPEDKLEMIFEPFFTTKEPGKGTGLGLSIVYDIIQKHNGGIAVKSRVGEGTTFTLHIPLVEK